VTVASQLVTKKQFHEPMPLSVATLSSTGSREEARAARSLSKKQKSMKRLNADHFRRVHPLLAHQRLYKANVRSQMLDSPKLGHGLPLEEPEGLTDELDNSKAKRRLAKWTKSLQNLFVTPLSPSISTVVTSYSSASMHLTLLKKEVKEFRDRNRDTRCYSCWLAFGCRQKCAFVFSSLVGTAILYSMFQMQYAILTSQHFFDGPLSSSKAFALSYYVSYLFSILWQHVLNRWLVFENSEDSFLDSLLSTYLVYGVTMLLTSILSMILITTLEWTPTTVFWFTLPVNGIANYYLLQRCFFNESKQAQITSVITVV